MDRVIGMHRTRIHTREARALSTRKAALDGYDPLTADRRILTSEERRANGRGVVHEAAGPVPHR